MGNEDPFVGLPPAAIEPPANVRQLAASQRMVFLAFVEQGFTEDQALALTCNFMSAVIISPGAGEL